MTKKRRERILAARRAALAFIGAAEVLRRHKILGKEKGDITTERLINIRRVAKRDAIKDGFMDMVNAELTRKNSTFRVHRQKTDVYVFVTV